IGLVMGAALNYANSSLRGTNNVYKPERTKQYDAESAVQTAIQYIKANQAAGGTLGQDLGLPCPTTTLTYTGASGAVAVDVCPQANSLIHQGGFRAVLLTLGTDPSEGLILSHNGDVNVGGTVFSNSIISLTNPTNLKVKAGRVWAWGDCTRPGNISINNPTGTPVCNASSTFGGQPPKVAQDPDVLSPAD